MPSSERIHIAFFGARNAGKSSLVNAITNQELSIVSDIPGTTTDPVKKSMELLPLGPICIIDTPGIDDEGELGEKRIERTYDVLDKTDIAILVSDAMGSLKQTIAESKLKEMFKEKNIPYIIVQNKIDLVPNNIKEMIKAEVLDNEILVSAKTGENIDLLKHKIGLIIPEKQKVRKLISDFVDTADTVVLVTPIDESAPKGRIILPQQMVLREILDLGATAIVCQPNQLKQTLANINVKPKLVITDSQVFAEVDKMVTYDIPLTSFSILMARYKGNLDIVVRGAKALASLKTGDRVLISEGCTHHRQCNDIGSVKMPNWIEEYTGAKLVYEYTSGQTFVKKPEEYKLIIHCGGCMLGDKEVSNRLDICEKANVPIVNYGVAIAQMKGILCRALALFPETAQLLD